MTASGESSGQDVGAGSGAQPGQRPDWLESTKHTRRRMPRVRIGSGQEREKRNPWLVGLVVWLGVAVVVAVVVGAVHLYQERDRVAMPAALGGLPPATDPQLVGWAQSWRDSMPVDPKFDGSRYEAAAFGTPSDYAVAVIVPMGLVWTEPDTAVIADENPDYLFGEPQAFGDVHCTTGTSGGDAQTWCFRSGDDYSVLVITGPGTDVSRSVLMVREAYAAQGA